VSHRIVLSCRPNYAVELRNFAGIIALLATHEPLLDRIRATSSARKNIWIFSANILRGLTDCW
jgi:hypothetical protein